ncbi:putative LRR receptor-like serine/threonine-protein kinase [Hordeum vulgare]|nr:putative LRR receptor-like serine/threonine-protein kinase [Hordeum vulgare]
MPVRADIRREAEALVNWKASLDGADESLGSWSMANSTSLCRWTHITCNSAGLMTELNLNTSLNGTLESVMNDDSMKKHHNSNVDMFFKLQ